MNSPSTSLAVLYPTETREGGPRRPQDEGFNASISSMIAQGQTSSISAAPLPRYPNNTQVFAPPNGLTSMQPPPPPGNNPSSSSASAYMSDPALVSDADLLLNLHSPFSAASSPRGGGGGGPPPPPSGATPQSPTGAPYHPSSHALNAAAAGMSGGAPPQQQPPHVGPISFGDMMIESQDIDMSALGDNMVTWLEWLPHDMVPFFDPTTGTTTAADDGAMQSASEQGDLRRGRE